MLKKEEVFVRVSSKKKARKLKELLDMFGEQVWIDTKERLERGIVSDEYPFVHYGDIDWSGLSVGDTVKSKTQVSLKELSNILAVEHLKEGDVVVCKYGDEIALGVFKEWESQFGFDLDNVYYLNDNYCHSQGHGGCFGNFIRYATEEEKALLNPVNEKKELEVGKWYKYPDYPNFLSIHATDGNRYGFDINGLWFNAESKLIGSEYVEATPQEVEQALINEAKRRYNVGDKLSKIYDDCSNGERVFSDKVEYQESDVTLWFSDTNGYSSCIFKDGQWADIVQSKDNDLERLSEIVNEAVTLITKLKNK